MVNNGDRESGLRIPIKGIPDAPKIPRDAEDPLRRATLQIEATYLKPYGNPKYKHHEASLERSIALHHLAHDARKHNDKLQQLAAGLTRVALLDDDQGWTPFKSGFPADLTIDRPTQDFLLDIACMRVWFDQWAIGNPALDQSIRDELKLVLEEFQLTPPKSDGEEVETFRPVQRSFQETISFLLQNPIKLTPVATPNLG